MDSFEYPSYKLCYPQYPIKLYFVPPIDISGDPITPSSCVLNIDVTWDSDLSRNSHIYNISKSTDYHIFNILCIRKNLTSPLTIVLITVIVLSNIN